MERDNVMTINEQLIEKFKRVEITENLANGILKAVRPGFELKELIAKEVRNKIVSLFSSREDKLKIDNRNVGGLINWENMEEQDLVPMPTNHILPRIRIIPIIIATKGLDKVNVYFMVGGHRY